MRTLLLLLCSIYIARVAALIELSYVTPDYMGISGGTTLYIYGSGFNFDEFNHFDQDKGNKVFLLSNEKSYECKIVALHSNEQRLSIITPKFDDGTTSSYYELIVYSGSEKSSNSLFVPVYTWTSPYISGVYPRDGMPGDVVDLHGSFFTNQFRFINKTDVKETGSIEGKLIMRVYMGGVKCLFVDEDLNEFFGEATDDNFFCKPATYLIGPMNASVLVSERGATYIKTESLYVDSHDKNYNYHTYAGISYTTNEGNVIGNTPVHVKGIGFDPTPGQTSVTIGGAECDIIDITDNELICLSPPQSEAMDSPGELGLRLETWEGSSLVEADLTDDSAWQALSSDDVGYSSSVITSFNIDTTNISSGSACVRLSGYLHVGHAGEYMLQVNTNGVAAVILNKSTLQHRTSSIDSDLNYNEVRFYHPGDAPLPFEARVIGESGISELSLWLTDYNAKFAGVQCKECIEEEQGIYIYTNVHKETQRITYTGTPEDVVLSINGQFSEPVDITDMKAVVGELYKLASIRREYIGYSSVAHHFGFEDNDDRIGTSGTLMADKPPYAGRKVLRLNPDWPSMFYVKKTDTQRVDILLYRYMCFAIMSKVAEDEMSITVRWEDKDKKDRHDTITFEHKLVIEEDAWTFQCIDLIAVVENSWINDNRNPTSRVWVTFVRGPDRKTEDDYVYVDELIFSRVELTDGPVTPSVFASEDILITEINPVEIDSTSYELRYRSANCGTGMPLLALSVTPDSTTVDEDVFTVPGGTVTIRRVKAATSAPTGTMSFKVNGKNLTDLPFDIDDFTLKVKIENALGATGIKSYKGGDCYSSHHILTYTNSHGEQELPEVDFSNLVMEGTNLNVVIEHRHSGRIEHQDIPPDFFSVMDLASKPEVVVSVNNYRAKCLGDCSYEYTSPAESTLTAVAAAADAKMHYTITATGTNFDSTAPEDYVFKINDEYVTATTVIDTTSISVMYGYLPAGEYNVDVFVIPNGLATTASAVSFTITTTIDDVTPATGSSGGGYEMMVTGTGLPLNLAGWAGQSIQVGGSECEVVAADLNSVTFIVAAGTNGPADVTINLNGVTTTDSSSFSYDSSIDTVISTTSTTTASSVIGGEDFVLTGTDFGARDGAFIWIGDKLCEIQLWSDTTATCTLPANSPGEYPVVMKTATNGFASGIFTVTYTLEVSSMSPEIGSVYGGTIVQLQGQGFGTDESVVKISFGDEMECIISEISDTDITCLTQPMSKNVEVQPKDKEWEPKTIEIYPGDSVTWKWEKDNPTSPAVYTVHSFDSETDEEFNGKYFTGGDPTASGSVFYQFDDVGEFPYGSNKINDKSIMRGMIYVVPREETEGTLKLTISDIEAKILDSNLQTPVDIVGCNNIEDAPITGCTDNIVTSDFNFITSLCYTPDVSSLTPSATQSIAGILDTQIIAGVTFTIEGSGFGTDLCQTRVTFGDAECVVSSTADTLISCSLDNQDGLISLSPMHLTVANVNRGNADANGFDKYILVPAVDSFLPLSGSLAGGTEVVILGSGLLSPDGVVSVLFGSNEATVTSLSNSKIVCLTPEGTAGNVPLTVKVSQSGVTAIDQTGGSEFTYDAAQTPTVSSVSVDASGVVTIDGANFDSDTSNVDVQLDEIITRRKRSVTKEEEEDEKQQATEKTIKPTQEEKTEKLKVKKELFKKVLKENKEHIEEPVSQHIPSVDEDVFDPINAEADFWGKFTNSNVKTMEESLKTNFWKKPKKQAIKETDPKETEVVNTRHKRQVNSPATCIVASATSSQITCNLNAPAGSYNLQISVLGMGAASISNTLKTLTVTASISSIDPDIGSTNGGALLTITGSGFNVLDASVTVGGADCPTESVTSTQIECRTPAQAAGTYSVEVTTGGNTATSPTDFEYSSAKTPVISTVTSTSVAYGDSIDIIGTGFDLSGTAPTVYVGSVFDECVVTYYDDAQITCDVPDLMAGTYEVLVRDVTYGDSMNTNTLDYTLTVTGATPNTGGYGGAEIDISGTSFDPNGGCTVTVCGSDCTIVSSTSSSITCIVPPVATVATGGDICDIVVTNPDTTSETLSSGFTFDPSLVATVNSVSPKRGGTAGGTTLTIDGSGFEASGNQVTIGGSPCIISAESTTQITCVTEAYNGYGEFPVLVKVPNIGMAATGQNGMFYYVDRWSSIYTWGGYPVPITDDYVAITHGQTVMIDESTAVLRMLLIDGGHVFVDPDATQEIVINTYYILITGGGSFSIGTEDEPFTGKATIIMHGNVKTIELPVFGNKVIGVREGTLDLHGIPIQDTWTRLSETAYDGDDVIKVNPPVAWKKGDVVVIATTEKRFSANENEERTVDSVSADGTEITLTEPLDYTHISIEQNFAGRVIETRAEVGLLTRNIKMMGTLELDDAYGNISECGLVFNPDQFEIQPCFNGRFGEVEATTEYGSLIILNPKEQDQDLAVGRFSYMEITQAGQAFQLGRYPIHFHLLGNAAKSYVKGCAIHRSFNRAVTIHNTNNLLIEQNVAYDVKGNTFFTEDGKEENNTLQYNLAIFTQMSSSLLNEDTTPASYWVVNPNNILRHNAAAGGTHFAVWYRVERNPTGASVDESFCQNARPLGEFYNNTAHSFGRYGLWIFSMDGLFPTDDGTCTGKAATSTFNDFLVWNCDRGAEVVFGGNLQFNNFVALDNENAGLEMVEMDGDCGSEGPGVFNSLIISYSDIESFYDTSRKDYHTILGVIAARENIFMLDNVTFVNFDRNDSAAIGGCSQCMERQGGYPIRARDLDFINSPNRVRFQWQYEHTIVDFDGSLSGQAGNTVVPQQNSLHPECVNGVEEFSVNADVPGSVCPDSVKFVRFDIMDPTPSGLVGRNMTMSNQYGSDYIPYKVKRLEHPGWMALLIESEVTLLEFDDAEQLTNISYKGKFAQVAKGSHFYIVHNLFQDIDGVSTLNGVDQNNTGFLPPADTAEHGDYFWDNEARNVSYIVKGRNGSPFPNNWDCHMGATKTINFEVYKCAFEDCVAPNATEIVTKFPDNPLLWSDIDTWEQMELGSPQHPDENTWDFPQDGQDLTIPPGVFILADVDVLPKLGMLYIYGGLKIEDGTDRILDITHMYIQGGIFEVGDDEDNPYTSQLTISFRGDLDQFNEENEGIPLPYPLPSLGWKAMGIFGIASFYGVDNGDPWVKLGQTAEPGDSVVALQDPVSADWAGKEVMITSSSKEGREAESFTVTSVSADGRELTLDGTLAYQHLGEEFTLSDGSYTYHMRAEVGLLTRNVVIEGQEYPGQEDDSFGGRVMVGGYSLDTTNYMGTARFSNVEFRRMGQDGTDWADVFDPRYTLVFYNVEDASESYVKSCSFNTNYNIAIGTIGTSNLVVDNNVVYTAVSSGVLDVSENNTWTNNLVASVFSEAIYNGRSEDQKLFWGGGFMFSGATPTLVQNNIAAGADQCGFVYYGDSNIQDTVYINNEVHSSPFGVQAWLKARSKLDESVVIANYYTWRCSSYGIYVQTYASYIVENVVSVDSYSGVFQLVYGPHARTHLCEEKTVILRDSLIVGSSPLYTCDYQQSDSMGHVFYQGELWKGGKKKGPSGAIFASFMSEANMAPKHPFSPADSYDAVCGHSFITNVTFSNFEESPCGSGRAMMPNWKTDDTIHPIDVEQLTFIDTPDENMLYINEPSLSSINPSDCVDMDCDGQRNILITDVDGSLIGSPGTIISVAEFEWDGDPRRGLGDYRIPLGLRTDEHGNMYTDDRAYPNKGIVRDSSCTQDPDWNAWTCHGLNHKMLVVESLDVDTEVRRLSPVGFLTKSEGEGYIHLVNGPKDHGWCFGYTCQERISTFTTVIATEHEYDVAFTSTPAQEFKLQLLNSDSSDALVLKLFYPKSQRYDVYVGGAFVEPTNFDSSKTGYNLIPGDDPSFLPVLSDPSGTNFFNRTSKKLHVTLRGDEPVFIKTEPIVVLTMGLVMDFDSFFEEDVVTNVALLLGINPANIRLVDVIREDTIIARRKKRSTEVAQLQFEIGSAPTLTINGTDADADVEGDVLTRENLTLSMSKAATCFQVGIDNCIANSSNVELQLTSIMIDPPIPAIEDPGPLATEEVGSVNGTELFSVIQQEKDLLALNESLEVISFSEPSDAEIDANFTEELKAYQQFAVQPVIHVYDATGELVSYLGTKEIPWAYWVELFGGPPNATLLGSEEVFYLDGSASFTGLMVTAPGDDYVLRFTAHVPSLDLDLEHLSVNVSLPRVASPDYKLFVDEDSWPTYVNAKKPFGFGLGVAIEGVDMTVSDLEDYTFAGTVKLIGRGKILGKAKFTMIGDRIQIDKVKIRGKGLITGLEVVGNIPELSDATFDIKTEPLILLPKGLVIPDNATTAIVTMKFRRGPVALIEENPEIIATKLLSSIASRVGRALWSNQEIDFSGNKPVFKIQVTGSDDQIDDAVDQLIKKTKKGIIRVRYATKTFLVNKVSVEK